MATRRFNPLHQPQIEAFDETAKQHEDPLTRFTARVLLHTGMRNGEFIHMRESWLTEEYSQRHEEMVTVIKVPDGEVCTKGVGETGKDNAAGANLYDRGEPCQFCRNRPDKDWAPNNADWTPKTKNAPRSIPLSDELADLYEWWFAENEIIPFAKNGTNKRIRDVLDESEIKRDVTAHDLRHTHGTMIARAGFNTPQILQRMGHKDYEIAERYIHFVGQDAIDAHLESYRDRYG